MSHNQNNSLIKSTKSQSPELKGQDNEILVDQPEKFDNLIKQDKIKDDKNENKDEINEKNSINKVLNQSKNDVNIILIDKKNTNDDVLNFNLNINFEQKNKNKENFEDEKNNDTIKNKEKSLSDRKNKYFDDINNSSIAHKEESHMESNTNKKSQGSDFALFKIVSEIGYKNSCPKTIESLDKLNPLSSINSQIVPLLEHKDINSNNNRNDEIRTDNFLKSISEPSGEEEDEKSNEDNITIKKKLSDDVNFNTSFKDNKETEIGKDKYKQTEIYKDIITTSNVDLNEACIKTNENLKSKLETSDFIQNPENEIKNINEHNSMNKIDIELFFKPNESKNKDIFIEETKKDIINDIKNIYNNNNLNIVKLNNHEIYKFITTYNNLTKDELDYDPDFYILDKSDDFINRRNNFLLHNYFSYIINEKSNDNENKLKKYKKNYNEKIPKLTVNEACLNNEVKISKNRIIKICDIENISSFFYNFGLYSPESKNKMTFDEKSLNEIIKSFTTYRKIYNDGNSFQRCFSYLLFETFLLKNQINKINYLIYDIKKTLNQKYLDLDKSINILIDIKESYSIDNLMNAFNNSNLIIDEIMISYIEDLINNINKVDSINKRKYQIINMNYLKTLSNVFEVNFEIFYVEENEKDKNCSFIMDKINIYCNSYNNNENNNNITANRRSNDSDDYQDIPTLHLLYFLNSFHIVYTKKCDIDSTLANSDFSRQHYYLPSLPNYCCPECNKNNPLDIIPYYEVVLCHKCLINYMKEILKLRVESFIKSNFSSIEYFTRPITVKRDIKIGFTLYKYITGNYIIQDFENLLDNTCFVCYKSSNNNININKNNSTNKIMKLKCQCQICQQCLEEKLKENMGEYKYLNLYELHTKKFTKCPCDNAYNINELLKYTKNKPSEKDKKEALQRLIVVLQDKCCICSLNKQKTEYIKLQVSNSQPHFICMDCYQKNIIEPINPVRHINMKYNNNVEGDKNLYHDLESSNSSLRDNDRDKKFFCNICNTQHIIIPENENPHKKEKNKLNKTISKCCKNCIII